MCHVCFSAMLYHLHRDSETLEKFLSGCITLRTSGNISLVSAEALQSTCIAYQDSSMSICQPSWLLLNSRHTDTVHKCPQKYKKSFCTDSLASLLDYFFKPEDISLVGYNRSSLFSVFQIIYLEDRNHPEISTFVLVKQTPWNRFHDDSTKNRSILVLQFFPTVEEETYFFCSVPHMDGCVHQKIKSGWEIIH